ncbi:MAG: hypothetical protein JKY27_07960 [Magnetovibrio sp.]|nr:hypothetical protein [Magnetovibrio sp.]
MKLGIFTTDTLHHAYFVQQLSLQYADLVVFEQTRQVAAPFDCAHAFEAQRDAFECEAWFDGHATSLADVCTPRRYQTLNTPDAIADIQSAALDAIVVFGTGKLSADVIQVCNNTIVNLHGGDPETYRGLDTHLWAIYHEEFADLITTLHTLSEELDDGRIISALPIALYPGMALHQLRKANTEVCVRLSLEAMAEFIKNKAFISRPQRSRGRYYSFMPSALKDICVRKFIKHTARL